LSIIFFKKAVVDRLSSYVFFIFANSCAAREFPSKIFHLQQVKNKKKYSINYTEGFFQLGLLID